MRRPVLALTLVTAAAALTACGPTGSGTGAASAPTGVTASDAALPEPINVVTAPPETETPTPTPTPSPSASTARPSATAKTSAAGGAAAPAKPAAGGGGPVAIGYSATADSPAAVDAAIKQAKADGKNVLLDFGATWCGNCKALDKTLGDSGVQGVLNASYHLVQVDIGSHSTANFNLLKKYDSQGSYKMPVLIVVTPDGTVRTDTNTAGLPSLNTGGFTTFLKKWAP